MKVLHIAAGLPSAERPYHQPFIKSQIESLKRENIDIGIYEILGFKSRFNYLKAIKEIRRKVFLEKYDVIHSHYSYCGLIAYLSNTKAPIVLSLMGNDILGTPKKNGKMTIRGRFDILLSKFIVERMAHIIVKSKKMNNLRTKKNVSVIPNGVDLQIFKPLNSFSVRNELGLPQDDFIILFLGNPNEDRKNIKLAKASTNMLKQKESDNKIQFINPYGVGQNEVVKYLNASDVLIFTSYWEGSPNVIKEAMATNLPIISTNVGDVEDIIKDTKNCFIVDFRVEDIAQKLELLFNRRTKSDGRKNIQNLDSSTVAKKIIKIYEGLIS